MVNDLQGLKTHKLPGVSLRRLTYEFATPGLFSCRRSLDVQCKQIRMPVCSGPPLQAIFYECHGSRIRQGKKEPTVECRSKTIDNEITELDDSGDHRAPSTHMAEYLPSEVDLRVFNSSIFPSQLDGFRKNQLKIQVTTVVSYTQYVPRLRLREPAWHLQLTDSTSTSLPEHEYRTTNTSTRASCKNTSRPSLLAAQAPLGQEIPRHHSLVCARADYTTSWTYLLALAFPSAPKASYESVGGYVSG